LVEPIIKDLEQLYNGKVGKAILTKLKAGKKINGHTDRGNYLDISRRNHIPITTNNKVFFAIGKGLLNMHEGECWEINNMQYHEVINDSEEDRIHLIIDIIPNEYIGK
jgi:aspartyl/asparaginyl beta-hydroxylase (cupin superfamily)